ncbi:MAG: hypothetical protein LBS01_00680 [Prevotellaceae bacterium]|jgi:C-terminal processing protease CtpA/Prc|nr:hypothetical protein [Prevotellaceae bacterium]
MKKYKSKFLFILTFVLISAGSFSQNADFQRIDAKQKSYELAVVWKEASYNFANMNNCKGLDMDSLYRAFVPVVENTENDYEYYKEMQRFLAHFNNGHTYCQMPDYLYEYIAFPLLHTKYENGKVLIENMGSHYSANVKIGDEILTINDLPALEYFQKYEIPYVSMSNEKAKIHGVMFGYSHGAMALRSDNKKLKLRIKKGEQTENIEIPYDRYIAPLPEDTALQNQQHYINEFYSTQYKNSFAVDSVKNFAYIHLTECNEEFHTFFAEKYDEIMKYGNLILDISDNSGGGSSYTDIALHCLADKDSIKWISYKARINNSLYKAKAGSRIYYMNDSLVAQEVKDFYYPYYYNNAYEDIASDPYINPIADSLRYKGNVYVIINHNTASAAEFFALMLSQNANVKYFGEQTAGALAQPLPVFLPSGLRVFINTCKTFDFQGNDVSSGFVPNCEYDFSDFYKTDNPNEILQKLIKVIKENSTQ